MREDAVEPALPDVVALSVEGLSIRQIAEQLELSKSTVHRMRRDARRLGLLPALDISFIVRNVRAGPEPGWKDLGQMDDAELLRRLGREAED